MKIKSISLHGPADACSPAELRVFTNQPDLDFSTIEAKPATQQWKLIVPSVVTDEPVEYQTKAFKFANVSHLTLFFSSNHGAPTTKLDYIGIFGEFMLGKSNPIITKYELLPNPADHKKEELLGSVGSKQGF